MSRPIRALVFDVGQVIVRVDAERTAGELGARAGLSAQEVLDRIAADPAMREWQEGHLTPGQWHRHVAGLLGIKLTFDEFCSIWSGALDPEPILEDSLFAALAERASLVLLSNTDPLHVACLEENFQFPRHFPARIYSCTLGACKPQDTVYREAIAQAGAAPEEILCIDDVPEFVEAACRAGMAGHRFETRETLFAELRSRGLLD